MSRQARQAYLVEASMTESVPPHERADFWTDTVTGYQCRLRFEFPHRQDFHGRAVRQHTPTHQLIGWRSDEVVVTRTPQAIEADPDEDYRLIFVLAGLMTLRYDGQEFPLRPARAGLAPMSESFQLWQGAATEAVVMTLPRRDFDIRLNRRDPRIAGLDLTTGLGRIVGDLVVGLHEERDTLDRQQFDAVSDRLAELVCMLLLGDDRPPVTGSLSDVEATVRRHIRANAHDPGLTPHSTAAALGWSLRQIQLALQAAGTTPRRLIKEERLELARTRLQSPAYRSRSITDLARQLGFSSASAFSSAFRHRYGVRPRDLR